MTQTNKGLIPEREWVEYYKSLQTYSEQDDEQCLVRDFFENEKKKAPHLRASVCMISCPCKRCTNFNL